MTGETSSTISSEIIEMGAACTIEDLCVVCKVEAEWLSELVEHAVIEPIAATGPNWKFASLSFVRVAKAKRLRHDLNLNTPGVALALDLLDEIEELRSRLKTVG